MNRLLHVDIDLGEPSNNFFGKTWYFVPTGLIPPPPRRLGHQSKKNDVYFALEAIVGILVFSKKKLRGYFHFLVGIEVFRGPTHHKLMRYHPPPIYVLCVSSHLWTFPMQI